MRASLKAVVLLCLPMLVCAQANPLRLVGWPAMPDEAVDVLRQCSMLTSVQLVYEMLRFAR